MPGKAKPVNPERVKELLKMFNDSVSIARYFGMKLAFSDDGNAVVELPYNPNLNHGRGGIHGGIYATMLDSVGALTAAVHHDSSCWLATSEMSVHFLLPVERTSLRAVGKILKHGRRQDIVEMRLYDEHERLVGHATGTFVVLSKEDTVE
jgi:uncharacterized protein (TIGR00369 family)